MCVILIFLHFLTYNVKMIEINETSDSRLITFYTCYSLSVHRCTLSYCLFLFAQKHLFIKKNYIICTKKKHWKKKSTLILYELQNTLLCQFTLVVNKILYIISLPLLYALRLSLPFSLFSL